MQLKGNSAQGYHSAPLHRSRHFDQGEKSLHCSEIADRWDSKISLAGRNAKRSGLIGLLRRVAPAKPTLAGLLAILLLFLLPSCGDTPTGTSKPSSPNRPMVEGVYMNHSPEAEYVGKEACRGCHAGKFETFLQSEMGRSWKPAQKSSSSAKFEGVEPVYDQTRDMHYLPFTRGEDMFLREFRLKGQDTVYKREEKIDYIIGSGQHTNSHLMAINGYLYQMPLTFYTQDQRWDLPPGFEDGANSRFSREIGLECITCHNALPDYEKGSHNQYHTIPDGIDCERCHGPGSIHIDRMNKGLSVDVSMKTDWSIVNPGKLDVDLQFDLCQRCHLQGTAVLNEGKSFADFRPGMRLRDHLNVFLPRYADSLNNFIMASHPDRLRMSGCFIQTHKENSASQQQPFDLHYLPQPSSQIRNLQPRNL